MVYPPMCVIFYGLDIPAAVTTSIVIQLAGVGTTALGHVRPPVDPRRALVSAPGGRQALPHHRCHPSRPRND